MSTSYAYARVLDPGTGALTYPAGSSGDFVAAPSPALEIVKRTLRTPRGACLAQPSLGVDWSRVNILRTTAEADGRAVILAALQPLVTARVIAGLTVTVEVDPGRGRLLYSVDFLDVRLAQRQRTTGAR